MARRYFIFLYPSEERIRSLLNLAVFALNPSEKWPSHVTVAGPFSKRPSLVKNLAPQTTAFSLGLGNFFPQGISTVHLRIGVPGIWNIWNKPDFHGSPVPHLSLYNGSSTEEGKKVFMRLSRLSLYFSFVVSKPTVVASVSGQESMALREQVDTSIIPKTRPLRIDDIRRMGFLDRLEIAEEALRACIPPPTKAKQVQTIYLHGVGSPWLVNRSKTENR